MNKCITCGVKGWFQGHCQKCRSKDTPVKCACGCHRLNERLWSMLTEEPNCCDEARDKWLKVHPNYVKPRDQKPIWEDRFSTLDDYIEGDNIHDHKRSKDLIREFILGVEKAAEERGCNEGYQWGYAQGFQDGDMVKL